MRAAAVEALGRIRDTHGPQRQQPASAYILGWPCRHACTTYIRARAEQSRHTNAILSEKESDPPALGFEGPDSRKRGLCTGISATTCPRGDGARVIGGGWEG